MSALKSDCQQKQVCSPRSGGGGAFIHFPCGDVPLNRGQDSHSRTGCRFLLASSMKGFVIVMTDSVMQL